MSTSLAVLQSAGIPFQEVKEVSFLGEGILTLSVREKDAPAAQRLLMEAHGESGTWPVITGLWRFSPHEAAKGSGTDCRAGARTAQRLA